MDCNELSWGWWDSQSGSFKCGERANLLLDGRVVFFLECNGALHRDKGRSDFWNVSILRCFSDLYRPRGLGESRPLS